METKKPIEEIKKLEPYLSEYSKEELAKILEYGEKCKLEGEKLKDEFWNDSDDSYFTSSGYGISTKHLQLNNLILDNEDSKSRFIDGLSFEDKKLFDSLNGLIKKRFYEEYLNDMVFYSGRIEKKYDLGEWILHYDGENNDLEYLKKWLNDHKNDLRNMMHVEIKKIGDEGVKLLVEELKYALKPGMKIDLSHSGIGPEGMKIFAKELKDKLQPGIYFDLRFNEIGDEGVEILAKEWKDSLKPGMTINLEKNNIGNRGIKALAEEWNGKLKPGINVGLRENRIGDEGVEELARHWKDSLQMGMDLNLYGNRIGDMGVSTLAKEWKDRLKIGMRITLNENLIGYEGVEELAKQWKDCLELGLDIGLGRNKFGDEGAKILMKEWNDKLQQRMHVNLCVNRLSEEMINELKGWEQVCKDKGIICEVVAFELPMPI